MTTAPDVSVIVPAFNASRTIGATLRSALSQTVEDLEIVVVDDGSTDDTALVVSAIADPRLRIVSQPNAGAAAARNRGIEETRGRYVALLDSDDLWVQSKLERQLAVLETDPSVVAVQSGAYFVNDDMQLLHVEPCQPSSDPLLDTLLFKNLPNNMSTLVVRREALSAIGGFDPELEILEDWDIHIRLARQGELRSLAPPLSLYRVHAGNRSRNLSIHVEPGFMILERLFADGELPDHVRRRRRLIYARFYTMLAGGALRARRPRDLTHWLGRAAVTQPLALRYMAALPARGLRRQFSRRRWAKQFALDRPPP